MRNAGKFLRETDLYLLALCVAASVAGIIAVFSATRFSLEAGEVISRDAIVMIAAVVLGIIICLVISAIDYEVILKLWPVVAGVSVLLMLSLFLICTAYLLKSTYNPFIYFNF